LKEEKSDKERVRHI